jgi:hypothetical protein
MESTPYARGNRPNVQYFVDRNESKLDITAQRLVELFERDRELLLVADDWSTYRDEEMAEIMRWREAASETRWLVDAPGHELKNGDSELRLKLVQFVLRTSSRWSAYLYGFPSKTTVLMWEGDIIDLWTAKSGVIRKFDSRLPRLKPKA